MHGDWFVAHIHFLQLPSEIVHDALLARERSKLDLDYRFDGAEGRLIPQGSLPTQSRRPCSELHEYFRH